MSDSIAERQFHYYEDPGHLDAEPVKTPCYEKHPGKCATRERGAPQHYDDLCGLLERIAPTRTETTKATADMRDAHEENLHEEDKRSTSADRTTSVPNGLAWGCLYLGPRPMYA